MFARSTLPPNRVIPDAVAKRLARNFNLEKLWTTGAIWIPEDLDALAAAKRPSDVRDPQGWEADRRALVDYISFYGPRTGVQGWNRLTPSEDVVPWSYRGES